MSNNLIECFMGFAPDLLSVQTVYATGKGADMEIYLRPDILYICCAFLIAVIIILSVKLKRTKDELAENKKAVGNSVDNDAREKILLSKIEEGLKNEEFKAYLQFIVDNKTKKIVSAETLSRWENSEGEIILPREYIGVMEKFGLISKLDYYMFEMACRKLSKWKGTDFGDILLSCNFTRITISEKDFADKIKNIADKYMFDRRNLLIEITEDSIEKNFEDAKNNILKVKELGFQIALDDIGIGYASLISLCEYPIDIVKIDRDILLMTDQAMGKELFLGIISLAHKLNLKVVCEGVETEEQNTFVSESECDFIQGWYYSKSLPENKAEAFAKEYMKNF